MNNGAARKPKNLINREKFLVMLDAAFACKAYRFGRQAVLSWLAIYPGDLQVTLWHAEMLAGDEKNGQAITILEKLAKTDVEYLEAYEALARLTYQQDAARFKTALSFMKVLGAEIPGGYEVEDWTQNLEQARSFLAQGDYDQAQEKINRVLGTETHPTLACIYHLQLVAKTGDSQALLELARLYQGQHPASLNVLLFQVEALMEQGNETEAVHLLHKCVSLDSTGQVARRFWGKEHAYKSIWPDEMAVLFDIPVPVEVAVRLRGAWLPVGEITSDSSPSSDSMESLAETQKIAVANIPADHKASLSSPSEQPLAVEPVQEELLDRSTLSAIEAEFERVAKNLKKPVIGRADGRYPVYVIFSSIRGLQAQYGPQTTGVVDLELHRLADGVKKRIGWETLIFYPDDEKCVAGLGLQPVTEIDPWKLKLSLADLDKALAKKGKMIGMLMIVGGPQVVPFHELPNPTDDFDQKILSDNPYATLDSNYFVPSWPIGRVPGGAGPDAALLLEQLRFLIAGYNRSKRMKNLTEGSVFWPFVVLIQSLIDALSTQKETPNIGYSAAVWRRSSTAVFKPVGNPNNLMISPPQESKTIPAEKLLSSEISYYNLHGMEDAGEWYGQRDPSESTPGPDYPVALSPKQLKRNGHAPSVVFSEACYGGHILNKTDENALSLKFLSLGTLVVVGSTGIAYGAVSTPLVAADLLGNYFWQQMRNGRTAGEALMIAKIDMAREMIKRQGYLDAEDQKTLLSFVLYGDPLATINTQQKRAKNVIRLKKTPNVRIVDEKPMAIGADSPLSITVLDDVKSKLARYLPGIDTAEIHISAQDSGLAPKKPGAKACDYDKCYVVTLSKAVPFAKSIHRHFARATVSADGRVIKLAVSR